MTHRAVEIANEFLRLPGASGRLTQMHLQKLGARLLNQNECFGLDAEQLAEYLAQMMEEHRK